MKSDFKLKSNNLKNKQFLLNHLLSDHKNYKRENRLPIWNILKLDNFCPHLLGYYNSLLYFYALNSLKSLFHL